MDEITRADVAALRQELLVTKQRVAQMEAAQTAAAPAEPARAGRRNFLKLAAAGAAVGTGAAVLQGVGQAAANSATGQAVQLGQTNSATNVGDITEIENPSPSNLNQMVLQVRNFTAFTNAPDSVFRAAIHASSADVDASGGYRIGVMGEAWPMTDSNKQGIGLYGTSNRSIAQALPTVPVGVFGTGENANGIGVKGLAYSGAAFGVQGVGEGANAIGVRGVAHNGGLHGVYGTADAATGAGAKGEALSNAAYGVLGLASTAIGVQAQATGSGGVGLNAVAPTTGIAARIDGRLRQVAAAGAGAPSGAGNVGEQWRDANGDMWICTVAGVPGTWRKVVAQHPNFSSAGGSVNFLQNPIRLLDTRPSGTAPASNGHNPLTANVDLQVDIAGISVGLVSVPTGATGIIGNLTAVPLTQNGFMTLWAENVPQPGTSNLNFRAGVNIANSFVCALSPAGKVRVRSSVSTNVLLDVVGFLY